MAIPRAGLTNTKLAARSLELALDGQTVFRVGNALVSININMALANGDHPVPLPLVDDHNEAKLSECYRVCDELLGCLQQTGKMQMIVHAGVSGSGKSFLTWKEFSHLLFSTSERHQGPDTACGELLRELYIACRAGHQLQDQLGNASTPANPSSSRFGRFIKLLFWRDAKGVLRPYTAELETFAWEKTRVHIPREGESTFRILDSIRTAHTAQVESFVAGLAHFFPKHQQDEIMGVLRAIVVVIFSAKDDSTDLQELARQFGINRDEVARRDVSGGLREYAATAYERLFQLVVSRVNDTLRDIGSRLIESYTDAYGAPTGTTTTVDRDSAVPCICLVDSPGKEVIRKNGLDQAIYNIWGEVLLASHLDSLTTEARVLDNISSSSAEVVVPHVANLVKTALLYKPLLSFLDTVPPGGKEVQDEIWARLEELYSPPDPNLDQQPDIRARRPTYDARSKTLKLTDCWSTIPTVYATESIGLHNAAQSPEWADHVASALSIWEGKGKTDRMDQGAMSKRLRVALARFMSLYSQSETVRVICCVKPESSSSVSGGIPTVGSMRQSVILQLEHLGFEHVLEAYGYGYPHEMSLDVFLKKFTREHASTANVDDQHEGDALAHQLVQARAILDLDTTGGRYLFVRESAGTVWCSERDRITVCFDTVVQRSLVTTGGPTAQDDPGDMSLWEPEPEDAIKSEGGLITRVAVEQLRGRNAQLALDVEQLEATIARDRVEMSDWKKRASSLDSDLSKANALLVVKTERYSALESSHDALRAQLDRSVQAQHKFRLLALVSFRRFVRTNTIDTEALFRLDDDRGSGRASGSASASGGGSLVVLDQATVDKLIKRCADDAKKYDEFLSSVGEATPSFFQEILLEIAMQGKLLNHSIPHLAIMRSWIESKRHGPVTANHLQEMMGEAAGIISVRLGDEMIKSIDRSDNLLIENVDINLQQYTLLTARCADDPAGILQAPIQQVVEHLRRSIDGRAEHAKGWRFDRAQVDEMTKSRSRVLASGDHVDADDPAFCASFDFIHLRD